MIKRTVYGTFDDLIKVSKKARKLGFETITLDDMEMSIEKMMAVTGTPSFCRWNEMSNYKGWFKIYNDKQQKEPAFRLIVTKTHFG